MRLLSVDWDYFVPSIDHEFVQSVRGSPIPYALRGGEMFPDALLDGLWDSRAAALLAGGQTLPGTTGDEETFWDRFQVEPWARMYFTKCFSPPRRWHTALVWIIPGGRGDSMLCGSSTCGSSHPPDNRISPVSFRAVSGAADRSAYHMAEHSSGREATRWRDRR